MSDTQSTQNDAQDQDAPHGADQAAAPTVEELTKALEESKAHSRKWEERAKANKDAADRLAAIEREKMTDAERHTADLAAANDRAAEAEARAAAAEASLARFKIATEFGLTTEDTEALAAVSDEAALRALAARLAGKPAGSPPKPNPSQGAGSTIAPSARDLFIQALNGE